MKRIFEVYPGICETEEPNSDNALTIACQQGKLEVVKVILENIPNWKTQKLHLGNVLNAACFFGDVSLVEYILKQDADGSCLNALHDGAGNALHKVCQLRSDGKNNEEINIEKLPLKKNPEFVDSFFNMPIPITCKYYIIAELLLQKNNNLLGVKNNLGDTPLHIACKHGDIDMIILFKGYLTEDHLNMKNANGQTPRELASILNYTNIESELEIIQVVLK